MVHLVKMTSIYWIQIYYSQSWNKASDVGLKAEQWFFPYSNFSLTPKSSTYKSQNMLCFRPSRRKRVDLCSARMAN